MTLNEQRKVLGRNAGIWCIASILSFVLPMITDSLTDGRSAFLRMLGHMLPLLVALLTTHTLLGQALKPPADA